MVLKADECKPTEQDYEHQRPIMGYGLYGQGIRIVFIAGLL